MENCYASYKALGTVVSFFNDQGTLSRQPQKEQMGKPHGFCVVRKALGRHPYVCFKTQSQGTNENCSGACRRAVSRVVLKAF